MAKLKWEIYKSTIIFEELNGPLPRVDRKTWQKISKDIEELNNIINQQDQINIYRTLHQSFQVSTEHRPKWTLTWTMNQTSANLKEIIQSVSSYYSGIKIDINSRKKTRKSPKTWKLKNTLLNNQEKYKKYTELNENEKHNISNVWTQLIEYWEGNL